MKITTKMKRHATGERGGKASKKIFSSTKLITMSIDPEKPEKIFKRKKKPRKLPPIYEVGDTVMIKSSALYSHPRSDDPMYYGMRSQELSKFIRDNAAIRGHGYPVNIVVEKVSTEGKVTTYQGKYGDFNVCFNDRYNSITKINNEY